MFKYAALLMIGFFFAGSLMVKFAPQVQLLNTPKGMVASFMNIDKCPINWTRFDTSHLKKVNMTVNELDIETITCVRT